MPPLALQCQSDRGPFGASDRLRSLFFSLTQVHLSPQARETFIAKVQDHIVGGSLNVTALALGALVVANSGCLRQ